MKPLAFHSHATRMYYILVRLWHITPLSIDTGNGDGMLALAPCMAWRGVAIHYLFIRAVRAL